MVVWSVGVWVFWSVVDSVDCSVGVLVVWSIGGSVDCLVGGSVGVSVFGPLGKSVTVALYALVVGTHMHVSGVAVGAVVPSVVCPVDRVVAGSVTG